MSSPTTLTLDAGRRSRGPRISGSEQAFALVVVTLLFLEHLAFGGGRREIALGFAAAQGLVLTAIILAAPWARLALTPPTGLWAPAALFCIMLLVAVWSTTPWVIGGPHPVWTYVAASPAAAVDKSAVHIQLIQLIALACVFLLGWLLGADDERARFALTALVLAGGAYAIWAFVSHLMDPMTIYGSVPKPFGANRLTGSFFGANTAGTYFGISAVLTLAYLLERIRARDGQSHGLVDGLLRRGAMGLVALAFSIACLVLTASRGAVAATSVALALFLVWEAVARRWRLLGPAGLGLLGLLGVLAILVVVGGTPLFARLAAASPGADRAEINLVHWGAFLASPWLGYGLGTFDLINNLVMTAPDYALLWSAHATHNVYLQWLEEAGALGAAPMFLCIASLIGVTVLAAFRRARMTTWLRALLAASLIILIHGATDFALQIPSMSSLWACLLGLGVGISWRPTVRR